MSDVDEKVERLILAMFVEESKDSPDWSHEGHLMRCPSLRVKDAGGRDGVYGCGTGCEYVRLTATLVCGHEGFKSEFDYGSFGDLATLLEDLEEMENSRSYAEWTAKRLGNWEPE